MAIYVVTITLPYESAASRFAVFHSNSETLFSPVFHEEDELRAHMFAAEYSDRRQAMTANYSESAQENLSRDLHAFLAEIYPNHETLSAPLPADWLKTLYADYDLEEEIGADGYDLLYWYRDGDPQANVAQSAFRAWRRARLEVQA